MIYWENNIRYYEIQSPFQILEKKEDGGGGTDRELPSSTPILFGSLESPCYHLQNFSAPLRPSSWTTGVSWYSTSITAAHRVNDFMIKHEVELDIWSMESSGEKADKVRKMGAREVDWEETKEKRIVWIAKAMLGKMKPYSHLDNVLGQASVCIVIEEYQASGEGGRKPKTDIILLFVCVHAWACVFMCIPENGTRGHLWIPSSITFPLYLSFETKSLIILAVCWSCCSLFQLQWQVSKPQGCVRLCSLPPTLGYSGDYMRGLPRFNFYLGARDLNSGPHGYMLSLFTQRDIILVQLTFVHGAKRFTWAFTTGQAWTNPYCMESGNRDSSKSGQRNLHLQ